ncbi:MAG TPA: cysteine hydrolase [Casimicrobiaceae bacterium]|nr:cysteine hydrolase [Casimicrobiaceae bacterium]
MPAPSTALLLVDFLNFMDFSDARPLAPHALRAAVKARALKARLARARIPVIYANDNFGYWESDIHAIVDHCISRGGAARRLAELIAPQQGDHSVLKPRHSAFFGTPLEFLLKELSIDRLVITGLTTDSCVMFTAHDAYLRGYRIWVPRDCVAAAKPLYTQHALAHIARVLKGSTLPSSASTRVAFARARTADGSFA